jgi:DNA-binding HxlR family transcriptional regulator
MARAANLLGDEWLMLVLRELFKGPAKFDELQKRTGAATNILTKRLTRMMEAGIVEKVPYQDKPPRFSYRLTKAGLGLLPVALELMRYAEQWMPSELEPPSYLRHLGCGLITRAGQHCSECGEALTLKNVRLEANTAASSA